eukprot:7347059-Prorocentrum_lima.AAC.1
MSLPVPPTVGVSIWGQDQWAYGVLETSLAPPGRPLIVRKTNPSRCASKLTLCVGLGCISLL